MVLRKKIFGFYYLKDYYKKKKEKINSNFFTGVFSPINDFMDFT
jgi:hypothetical protein